MNEERNPYEVIVSTDLEEFESQVNSLIENGWRPTGGIATMPLFEWHRDNDAFEPTGQVFFQAMFREDGE